MKIRSARPADLPYVLMLEKRFSGLGLVGTDTEEVHKQRFDSPDSSYLVFEQDYASVGFVILCGLTSVHRSVELKRVIVAEPGNGLGREGLRLTIRKVFCEIRAHRLWLDVYEDNLRARRAYRALGFVEEGIMRE